MSKIIIAIGEILFDIFPNSKNLGGAPFNFAYHVKKLGMETRFISRVGADNNGQDIIQKITSYGFDPEDIQMDEEHETGLVNVKLNSQGIPSYEIKENAAYDYIQFTNRIDAILKIPPALIYFGTLAQRTKKGMDNIQTLLLHRHLETKCLLDVNLRKGHISEAAIFKSLLNVNFLKLNETELKEISRIFGYQKSHDQYLEFLFQEFPLEVIALTLGKDGVMLYNNTSEFRINEIPIKNIADTVGAGDAFASVFAIGCLHGWSLEKIGTLASKFAAEVCQVSGAIILDEGLLSKYRRKLNA